MTDLLMGRFDRWYDSYCHLDCSPYTVCKHTGHKGYGRLHFGRHDSPTSGGGLSTPLVCLGDCMLSKLHCFLCLMAQWADLFN